MIEEPVKLIEEEVIEETSEGEAVDVKDVIDVFEAVVEGRVGTVDCIDPVRLDEDICSGHSDEGITVIVTAGQL
jgi:hypothetical protein